MENSDLLKVILTSSLVAGIFSAVVSAIVSMKLKNLDYKNEYYKKILEKRLEAYKYIEAQISVLKSSVLDEDGKPYHTIFSYGEQEFYKFQENLHTAIAYGMWINDETSELMDKLNEIFFKISRRVANANNEGLITLGKDYYQEISVLRKTLEHSVRKDLLGLHNFKKFKKSRGPQNRTILLEKIR